MAVSRQDVIEFVAVLLSVYTVLGGLSAFSDWLESGSTEFGDPNFLGGTLLIVLGLAVIWALFQREGTDGAG